MVVPKAPPGGAAKAPQGRPAGRASTPEVAKTFWRGEFIIARAGEAVGGARPRSLADDGVLLLAVLAMRRNERNDNKTELLSATFSRNAQPNSRTADKPLTCVPKRRRGRGPRRVGARPRTSRLH